MAAKQHPKARAAEPKFTKQKPVIAVTAVCIIIMFLTSFMQGGNIPGEQRTTQQVAPSNNSSMAEIPALMEKLNANPKDTVTLKELAEAFSRANDWDNAALFWGKLIEISPQDIVALEHRGTALMHSNRYHEAIADYEKVLLLYPGEIHALFNLGLIYKYGHQDDAKARSYFQQALDTNPQDPNLLKAIKEELQS
ncbi:MAG: tetratricopeptide repeat protein [Deltaproteobacteria bacterium]|jgi:tetratricopeptide (TPR) repeat protein|nr:tetratricopeptide repeat protein [Deltaproteobacteria bacterium]